MIDRPWRVQVLGPVRVLRHDGRSVEITQAKVRSVLAHLALAEGATVGTDRLIESLWADDPPRSAVKTLHGYVARLRRLLDDTLVVTSSDGYRLNTAVATVDSALFTDLVDRAVAEPTPRRRAALLDRALGLHRGTPLADVPSEYLQARYGVGLVERRLAALEDWAQARLHAGDTNVVSELLAATAEQPFRERLWELLISAQTRRGQRTEALRSYQRVRDLLREQLGAEPGDGLQRAHRRVLASNTTSHDGTAGDRAGTVDHHDGVVEPGDPGDVVERDILAGLVAAAQGRAQEATRSVILHGGPGCGKTTAARRLAESLRGAYPGGVTAIGLADGSDLSPGGLARRLMRSWRAPVPVPATDLVFAARQAWQDRRCLLVIDDVPPGVPLGDLLPAPPGCAAIVCATSALVSPAKANRWLMDRLDGARVAHLIRDQIGADRWDEDPRAARQLVEFSDGLAAAVHAIVMRLAPRSPLTVAELAGRLARPERRLTELDAGEVSVRSHFLRAYRWLDPPQQRAFRLLSLINAASFPLAVASACLNSTQTDVRDLLEQLHACHLLRASTDGPGTRYRFGTLEALFAREQSQFTDSAAERANAVRRALSAWYARGGPSFANAPVNTPVDGVTRPQLMPMSSRQTAR